MKLKKVPMLPLSPLIDITRGDAILAVAMVGMFSVYPQNDEFVTVSITGILKRQIMKKQQILNRPGGANGRTPDGWGEDKEVVTLAGAASQSTHESVPRSAFTVNKNHKGGCHE
ncbi:MAG: hypothetical protein ABFD64_02765 [Armatimonadota bacterium]